MEKEEEYDDDDVDDDDAFNTSDYVASNESKISKKLIKIHVK
jgi:hypothetical protein